jgi:hypothetical protein
MSQVEVCLRPIFGHIDLSMLKGVHRSRVHIDVRIELKKVDLQLLDSRRVPMDADDNPFPKEETTPPVTKYISSLYSPIDPLPNLKTGFLRIFRSVQILSMKT